MAERLSKSISSLTKTSKPMCKETGAEPDPSKPSKQPDKAKLPDPAPPMQAAADSYPAPKHKPAFEGERHIELTQDGKLKEISSSDIGGNQEDSVSSMEGSASSEKAKPPRKVSFQAEGKPAAPPAAAPPAPAAPPGPAPAKPGDDYDGYYSGSYSYSYSYSYS